jgi:hypothetical protein
MDVGAADQPAALLGPLPLVTPGGAIELHRLIAQRQASPHTIASYRDTFRLLLGFAQDSTSEERAQLHSPTSTSR